MRYALDAVFVVGLVCAAAGVWVEFGTGYGLIAFGVPLAAAAWAKG